MDKKDDSLQAKIDALETKINQLNATISRQNVLIDEYQKKEQSISNAIIASMEHANQLEASRKKLYALDIQRSRFMYLRMEQIINELYAKYPELKKDPKLKDMSEKFKALVYEGLKDKNNDLSQIDAKKQTVVDDPIKKLLRNIIDCFEEKKVGGEINRGGPTDALLAEETTGGFDFNEALHPTMSLEEIMKAFNLNVKTNK